MSSSTKRVAVVTGANKGIGLAIVRQLALQYPSSPLAPGSLLIYLTARDRGRGEEALRSLRSDDQLRSARALSEQGGVVDVEYHPLDISEPESIEAFASHVRKTHPDGIDVVINNAGVALSSEGFNESVVEQTLRCNYYGTLHMTEVFLPLLRAGSATSRLVNVASMSGHLSAYPPRLRDRFLTARTVSDISALMSSFTTAVAQGTHEREGWPSRAYGVSKAGCIGMTRAVAAQAAAQGHRALINVCCPGYVRTDMTRGGGAKTPDQGALTPVMLTLADIGGVSGGFWQHEKRIEW